MEEKETIQYSDFAKVELKIGKVLNAEKIEGADKLLKLTISLGNETRTICAGIAQHYEPDYLVGKKVVVVANLASKKTRGVESQGMILAASDAEDTKIIFLTPEKDIEEGSKVR